MAVRGVVAATLARVAMAAPGDTGSSLVNPHAWWVADHPAYSCAIPGAIEPDNYRYPAHTDFDGSCGSAANPCISTGHLASSTGAHPENCHRCYKITFTQTEYTLQDEVCKKGGCAYTATTHIHIWDSHDNAEILGEMSQNPFEQICPFHCVAGLNACTDNKDDCIHGIYEDDHEFMDTYKPGSFYATKLPITWEEYACPDAVETTTTTSTTPPGVAPTTSEAGVVPTTTEAGVAPTTTEAGVAPTTTEAGVAPTTTTSTTPPGVAPTTTTSTTPPGVAPTTTTSPAASGTASTTDPDGSVPTMETGSTEATDGSVRHAAVGVATAVALAVVAVI